MTAQYQRISKIKPTSLLILRFGQTCGFISLGFNATTYFDRKTVRDNVACVVAFHNPSQIGMKSLFEEFGGNLDSQTRKNLMKNLKSENIPHFASALETLIIVIFEFRAQRKT